SQHSCRHSCNGTRSRTCPDLQTGSGRGQLGEFRDSLESDCRQGGLLDCSHANPRRDVSVPCSVSGCPAFFEGHLSVSERRSQFWSRNRITLRGAFPPLITLDQNLTKIFLEPGRCPGNK